MIRPFHRILLTLLLLLSIFIFSHTLLYSQCLILKDGTLLQGTLTDQSEDLISVHNSLYSLTVNKNAIDMGFPSYQLYKAYERNSKFKRHFFDLQGVAGASITSYYNKMTEKITTAGGLIGMSIGYQYAVHKYFALGVGLTGFLSILYTSDEYYQGINTVWSGGVIMLQMMAGDLHGKKIAFLFDVGAGWLFATKMGIYIKGYVIKLGYHASIWLTTHHITFDFGYKLNWSRKIKQLDLNAL